MNKQFFSATNFIKNRLNNPCETQVLYELLIDLGLERERTKEELYRHLQARKSIGRLCSKKVGITGLSSDTDIRTFYDRFKILISQKIYELLERDEKKNVYELLSSKQSRGWEYSDVLIVTADNRRLVVELYVDSILTKIITLMDQWFDSECSEIDQLTIDTGEKVDKAGFCSYFKPITRTFFTTEQLEWIFSYLHVFEEEYYIVTPQLLDTFIVSPEEYFNKNVLPGNENMLECWSCSIGGSIVYRNLKALKNDLF